MKNLKYVLVVALLGAGLSFASPSYAGRSSVQAKLLLSALAVAAKYPRMEVRYSDVGTLRQGSAMNYRGKYVGGIGYLQIAQRDNANQDVDIAVYDQSNNQICKDVDVDRKAGISVCTHTPKWTGPFRVNVKMYRGSGWYGYMVMYQRRR